MHQRLLKERSHCCLLQEVPAPARHRGKHQRERETLAGRCTRKGRCCVCKGTRALSGTRPTPGVYRANAPLRCAPGHASSGKVRLTGHRVSQLALLPLCAKLPRAGNPHRESTQKLLTPRLSIQVSLDGFKAQLGAEHHVKVTSVYVG